MSAKHMAWAYPPPLESAVREAAKRTGIPLVIVKSWVDSAIGVASTGSWPEVVLGVIREKIDEAMITETAVGREGL